MAVETETAHFAAYSVGLCYASVCTDMSDEEATAALNARWPTGIASAWRISDDSTFASGQPNPCPCETKAEQRHILFSC